MKLFHGTSMESLEDILKNGFSDQKTLLWNCSSREVVYFWNLSKVRKSNGYTLEQAREESLRLAFDSGVIASVLQKSTHDKTIVLELDVPGKYVQDDDSCPNMEGEASYVHINDLKLSYIKKVYYRPFSLFTGALHLASYVKNDLSNIEEFLSREEIEMVEQVSTLEISSFWENWYSSDWEEMAICIS